MKPSDIIVKIDYLYKEINTLIEKIVSDKGNPNIMNIDLLNQKLITIYDLALKLRYNLNLDDVEVAKEVNDLEYFHFEPETSRFIIEKEELNKQPTTEEKKEDISHEAVIEPIKETVVEPVKEAVVEPVKEAVVEPIKEAEIETFKETLIEPNKDEKEISFSEEMIPKPEQNEKPYWSVEKGWSEPIAETIISQPIEEITPIQNITEKPEPIEDKPITELIQNETISLETEVKDEPVENKPIFESIPKHERSLNEMMAENKDKSVLNENQKIAFTDFKSAITLNLKISFIRELFQGNEKDYKKMIEFLTKCENYSEAKLYMQGEKENHPEWISKQDLLNHLQELINRKFL